MQLCICDICGKEYILKHKNYNPNSKRACSRECQKKLSGRPKGSKNKNPYPHTDAVLQRYKDHPPPPCKGHTLDTRAKMSVSMTGVKKKEGTGEKFSALRIAERSVMTAEERSRKFGGPLKNGKERGNKNLWELGGWKTVIKGFFRPKYPEKYRGDPTKIVYRSSYELKYLRELDMDKDVEWYQSEEFFIPYFDRSRNKMGRYFPDMLVHHKNGTTVLVEIKPEYQTRLPKRGKNERAFIRECIEYTKNASKWEEAQKYCEKRGWQFRILTEKHLGIKGYNDK